MIDSRRWAAVPVPCLLMLVKVIAGKQAATPLLRTICRIRHPSLPPPPPPSAISHDPIHTGPYTSSCNNSRISMSSTEFHFQCHGPIYSQLIPLESISPFQPKDRIKRGRLVHLVFLSLCNIKQRLFSVDKVKACGLFKCLWRCLSVLSQSGQGQCWTFRGS